jgi:hypothetical protein
VKSICGVNHIGGIGLLIRLSCQLRSNRSPPQSNSEKSEKNEKKK